jgi:hypothetical protein
VERLDQLPVHRLPAAVRHGAGVAVPLHASPLLLLALLSPHRRQQQKPESKRGGYGPALNIHKTNRIKTIDLAGARKI